MSMFEGFQQWRCINCHAIGQGGHEQLVSHLNTAHPKWAVRIGKITNAIGNWFHRRASWAFGVTR